MKDSREQQTTRGVPSLAWLAAGALAGLAAAAYGLLQQDGVDAGLPANAVARVNETVIDSGELDRAVARLEATYGLPVSEADRARLLEQMIEEELLVQRGIDLGMPASEATVRSAIVQSLVASVTAEADAANPDDATLQAFLDANADRYTFASAMTIDAWTADRERDARYFLGQLGANADAEPGDTVTAVPGLPRGPSPLERLRMFVGPAIAAAAADMPVGSSAVFSRQGRWYVVRVNSRDESAIADLDSVRSQVLLDYRRSLADDLLGAYLADLRERAEITVAMPE